MIEWGKGVKGYSVTIRGCGSIRSAKGYLCQYCACHSTKQLGSNYDLRSTVRSREAGKKKRKAISCLTCTSPFVLRSSRKRCKCGAYMHTHKYLSYFVTVRSNPQRFSVSTSGIRSGSTPYHVLLIKARERHGGMYCTCMYCTCMYILETSKSVPPLA